MSNDISSQDLANLIFENGDVYSKAELAEFAKEAVKRLYFDFRDSGENISQVKCTKELIEKMIEHKPYFRLNKNIDTISIPYAEAKRTLNTDIGTLVEVKLSIMFYDNSRNNEEVVSEEDRYWNDSWYIYLKPDISKNDCTCAKCGANMKFDEAKDILECDYCGNKVLNAAMNQWRFIDIKVER